MSKIPEVDQNTCIGCMMCVQIASKVFEMQDDGRAKTVHPTGDTEENIQEAINNCPVSAIKWKE